MSSNRSGSRETSDWSQSIIGILTNSATLAGRQSNLKTPCKGFIIAFLALTPLLLLPSIHAGELPAKKETADLKKRINAQYPYLKPLYEHFHSHPEIAFQEKKTAARLAMELRKAGFTVTENVGITGVVAVLKNGKGPVVMVRADMDALPVTEKTKLPYASKVRVRDSAGRDVGVMHACGHDVNMTCLVGLARMMADMKNRWKGTLMLIGQPAEEIGQGARMMLQDGLFKRFPRPDYAFALHCDGRHPHGAITYREGQMQANVDSMDIIVKGRGGHGAAPHKAIDPVVIAARIVLDLQTIVSREHSPIQPAVVTVGSIHGGTKHNIIPNDVHLQLTIRTISDASRKQVLEAIVRIAKAAALAANAPEPEIQHNPGAFTPSLFNDPKLTRKTVTLFEHLLGKENVIERPMSMGGEDFSQFVRAGVTGFYFHLGCMPPEKVAADREGGTPLPSIHSDAFYPIPEPTIKTGLLCMTSAVLDVMGSKD